MAPFKKTHWIIGRLCKPDLQEEIIGNLEEYYYLIKNEKRRFNTLIYWREVLNYLRPTFLKSTAQNKRSMFLLNPQLAFRNLLKHKVNTMINLSGFIIGLVSVIFLYFYIHNETSYDSFHQDKDQIYRLIRQSDINGTNYNIGVTSGPYGPAIQSDYPDLVNSTLRVTPNEGLISYKGINMMEDDLIFADKNFFEFFSFPLDYGDPLSVLDQPNSVVISREMAKKYFHDEDPLGKIIEVDKTYKFIVSGIMGPPPSKSHIRFDMVFNIQILESFDWFHEWWNNGLMTYVKIDSPQKATELSQFLPSFMDKYFTDDIARSGNKIRLALEPLTDIYFNETRYDPALHGNKTNITILTLVAFAILFIACFNYLNLSLAQSHKRAKEVGIRKILGVHQSRLVLQFLGESLIIVILSIALAAGVSEGIRPALNTLFDLDVVFNWTNPTIYLVIIGLLFLITLSAGAYPAVLLSSFKPLSVLKGNKLPIGKSLLIRKSLVVMQFVLSTFLILGTMITAMQLAYVQNKNLGFNQQSVLIVKNYNDEIQDNETLFIDRVKNLPYVVQITGASGEPGGFHDGIGFSLKGSSQNYKARSVFADENYLKTFGINVVAGRGFNDSLSTDIETAMMINKKVLKDMGMAPEEVIGKKAVIPGWDLNRKIIGVYEDYHFLSLRESIEPQVIVMSPHYHRRIAIKLNTKDTREALTTIENLYSELAPTYPMHYDFLDDSLSRQYIDEEKQASIFFLFSGISIFLASLGVFGLASHSAQQRQKELGIRKILGARVIQIIKLISREFMLLVMVAAIIAIPVTILFMKDWLGNFAYHITLSDYWITFPVGASVTALITAITIGLKTYRTAVSNPVNSIRYE